MSMDKWATSKPTQLSTKVWFKLLLLFENDLQLHVDRGPPTNCKFEPSPPWYRSKHFVTLKSKDLATCGFQKKIPDTPTKTCWSRAQFQKSSAYPLQKYTCFSPLTSGLVSFGNKSTPFRDPGQKPTIQNSSYHEDGRGLECRKVSSPQKYTLTPASYSHW